jgi:hypothetical protein
MMKNVRSEPMRAESPPAAGSVVREIDIQGTAVALIVKALLVLLCAAYAALLLAFFSPSVQAADCTNEAIRAEQGSAALGLPECRAYELVSPGSTPFVSDTNLPSGEARASTTGDGLAYSTPYPAIGAEKSGWRYLATRGLNGWSVEVAVPQDGSRSAQVFSCFQGLDFSEDLSKGILSEGWSPEEEGSCPESEEVMVPSALRGYANLFFQDGITGPYGLINLTPGSAQPANAILRDYTADLSHVIFQEAAQLTDNAPPGDNLYEWTEGALHLIPVLPNGKPVAGDLANGAEHINREHSTASITNAMSADGESVFFNANGNLYLRRNATQPQADGGACSMVEPDKACTIQIDRKQGGTEEGGGVFWYASEDASRVFFAAENRLTANSKAGPEKPDLYEYDVVTGFLRNRTLTGSFESPNARGLSGAGEGENGTHLYFVARGVLTGSGQNIQGAVAQPFSPNLYLMRDGKVSFITTLDGVADRLVWQEGNSPNTGNLQTSVSPSGRYLAFPSVLPLTGFDNSAATEGACGAKADCTELFLFDAQSRQLSCVSCGPEGVRPIGNTYLAGVTSFSFRRGAPAYVSRQVFDDGRVVFTTPNVLASGDVNGAPDVYQYRNGLHELIGSGTAFGGSVFIDASPGGSNIFFTTSEGLVASDADNGISIYDARVGGGFLEPQFPPPPCEGESCRGQTPIPPAGTTPGSLNFAGPQKGSNKPRRARCKQGFVRRQGKCRKRVHRRGQKHRQGAKKDQKRATPSSNQRNAK